MIHHGIVGRLRFSNQRYVAFFVYGGPREPALGRRRIRIGIGVGNP